MSISKVVFSEALAGTLLQRMLFSFWIPGAKYIIAHVIFLLNFQHKNWHNILIFSPGYLLQKKQRAKYGFDFPDVQIIQTVCYSYWFFRISHVERFQKYSQIILQQETIWMIFYEEYHFRKFVTQGYSSNREYFTK